MLRCRVSRRRVPPVAALLCCLPTLLPRCSVVPSSRRSVAASSRCLVAQSPRHSVVSSARRILAPSPPSPRCPVALSSCCPAVALPRCCVVVFPVAALPRCPVVSPSCFSRRRVAASPRCSVALLHCPVAALPYCPVVPLPAVAEPLGRKIGLWCPDYSVISSILCRALNLPHGA